MTNQKITLLRLQKQQRKLDEDPIPHVLVTRKGVLQFHFCIYGLEECYKNGYYWGVLELHENYPFEPPKLMFYTPSGRFQTNKPICTTFTNYHKETWTAGWNVRTMLMATVSFMTSNEQGTGCLSDGFGTRKNYADKSLEWNLKSEDFKNLFEKKLRDHPEIREKFRPIESEILQMETKVQPPSVKPNNMFYYLLLLLVIVLFLWKFVKESSDEA